jgi:hypothetical protein
LRDSGDDLILELAVAAGCRYIITHNLRDFRGQRLGGSLRRVPVNSGN